MRQYLQSMLEMGPVTSVAILGLNGYCNCVSGARGRRYVKHCLSKQCFLGSIINIL
jgi:hypothetical protein